VWPTAAIGEFPSWNVGPPHGVASSVMRVGECRRAPVARVARFLATPLFIVLGCRVTVSQFCRHLLIRRELQFPLPGAVAVRAKGTAASIRFAACAHGWYWHTAADFPRCNDLVGYLGYFCRGADLPTNVDFHDLV